MPHARIKELFDGLYNWLIPDDREPVEQHLLELGKLLRQHCWDLYLPLLDNAEATDSYKAALELLKLSAETKVTPQQLKEAVKTIRRTNWATDDHPRRYFDGRRPTDIYPQLCKLDERNHLTWTPQMSVPELASAISPMKNDSQIRRLLEKGEWESDPPYGNESRKRRYRSRNLNEQAEVLIRIRNRNRRDS